MILTGQTKAVGKKSCVSATLSTTCHTWTDVESNPDLHGETLVINRLSNITFRFGLYYV